MPDRALTQYLHRIWQTQQGLPQGTLYAIAQTRDGYLWLGSQTGLVRFDGVRFTPAGTRNGISLDNIWVRELLVDKDGDLWVGSNDSGLFHLHADTAEQFSLAQGLPADNVHCLIEGKSGEVWACTSKGLARIAGGKVSVFRTAQGLSDDNLRAACQANDGSLWFGGAGDELNQWNGAEFKRRRLSLMPRFASTWTMRCAADGTFWIGTGDGLIQLKDGHERRISKADGLPDNRIFDLQSSRDGGLWIGTNEGFSRWRDGEIESFRSRDGLSQSGVHSLFEDREGALWVGTKNGLNQFLDGRAIPYTVNEGLPANDAGPIVQDGGGTTWVGTLGKGLARFDGRRFHVLTTAQGLLSNMIYSLAADSVGDLWVGSDAGLNRLRGGVVAQTMTSANGLPGKIVRAIFRDHEGVLWVGTSNGLTTVRDGKLVEPKGFHGVLKAPIVAFGEDRDHRMLIATEGSGLYVYDKGIPKELIQEGMMLRDVDSFYTDRDGFVWMGGLGGGLRLLKDGRVKQFYLRDGLFDNEIYGIAADGEDRLWMACSKGIFSVKRTDLLDFAAGKILKFESRPYSPLDGLRTIECKAGVQPAVWTMNDGRVWFSTIRGVLLLDVSHLQHKFEPPPVVIEDVTVNGQSGTPTDFEKLPAGLKNIEFHYTGLSFVVPAKLTFRYILEGFDKNWIEAGTRREAFYTNLPPGPYRFRVTACNVDGTCNAEGAFARFVLAPSFYQQVWFLPLCILLAGFAVWGAYQLRIRRLREQFDLILAERSRIARELHDTLIQGFSGVTMEMQALSGRLFRAEEKETLVEIIADAGTCLREARRSVAGLRSARGQNAGLAGAIAEAAKQITETKDVRLKLRLEPRGGTLPADVEYNLLRIAQEAVSNSVKHSGARNIEIGLRSTPEWVRLMIKDDGEGFKVDQAGYTKTGHYGLIGMKERASHIGAQFGLTSEVGRGTIVSIELPTARAGKSE